MTLRFPCEIISWHVLPAVRREIAKYLVLEKKLPRKEVSERLGITEAAICQYLKSKRGGTHKFNEHDIEKIKELAETMVESKKGLESMCMVCREFDASEEILSSPKAQKT